VNPTHWVDHNTVSYFEHGVWTDGIDLAGAVGAGDEVGLIGDWVDGICYGGLRKYKKWWKRRDVLEG